LKSLDELISQRKQSRRVLQKKIMQFRSHVFSHAFTAIPEDNRDVSIFPNSRR